MAEGDSAIGAALLQMSPAQYGWLALAFVCVILHYLAEPARWTTLFPAAARFRTWLSVFGFTALVSYVFPFKLGLPLRIYFLNRKLKLSLPDLTSAMTLDAMLYYGLWLLAGIAGFSLLTRRVDLPELPVAVLLPLALAGAAVAVLVLLRVRRRLTAGDWRGRIAGIIERFTPARMGIMAAIVTVDILSQLARHFAMLVALGYSLAVVDITALTAFAILAGLLSFTPMGLGGYDAVMVGGLTQLGVPVSIAVLVAVLNRVLTIAAAALIGSAGGHHLGMNPFRLASLRALLRGELAGNRQ
ncbi:MAG: flippase-like domain-containing protein [Gammaproteobacteria bacterium]|nr:flippase-like domain-containing protein [Gammaproteobacteria bacterium]